MEFALLPFYRGKSPREVEKTLYVCTERYDGSPWGSYPAKRGRGNLSMVHGIKLDELDQIRALRVSPIPLKNQEAFVQTWLYFGLIAEFMGVGLPGLRDGALETPPDWASDGEILDIIYETVLVQEGQISYVRLNDDGLKKFLETSLSRMPPEDEARKARFNHLDQCLRHVSSVLNTVPKDLNHAIRFSITFLAEILSYVVINHIRRLGGPSPVLQPWSTGYFTDEMRRSMIMDRGWCPSDIARCEAKFNSLESLHVIQMMDKSLPERHHGECTEYSCNIYQIVPDKYHVGHRMEGCLCGEELAVDSAELTRILFQGDQIPLLRLEGGLHDLRAELVESTANSKYIAISHVWADGLGNPHANALHRCKLLHLRELVTAVSDNINFEQSPDDKTTPLIWLDTLCCPAEEGPGKDKGIEKIYNVYKQAEHVLVLDSSLMSYAAEAQLGSELALRIFTSSWVRRLWTLQEGALAKSLYFQFADKAVSLQKLRERLLYLMVSTVQQQALGLDVMGEFWQLEAFFHAPENPPPGDNRLDLGTLDKSLQSRGVSVPTDEPLCIAALMSLDVGAVLGLEKKQDRMKMIWKLLAKLIGGLPSQIIFFEERKMEDVGWRWAPRSLLQTEKGFYAPGTRIWSTENLGKPTDHGLRVTYPGYLITIQNYGDRRPRNPWPGFPRIPESFMHFRHAETGRWYLVGDKKTAVISKTWNTNEDRHAYDKLGLFPLHDMSDTENSVIICTSSTYCLDAIFATLLPGSSSESFEDGLRVKAERQITVSALDLEDGYISETVRKLALSLREDKLTDAHLELFNRLEKEIGESVEDLHKIMGENELFKASLEALKQKMKDMIIEVVAEDERFVHAVKTYLGDSFLDDVWVLIRNFFRHGYIGTELGGGQVWFVD